jgi:hypothetical protein
MTDRQQLRSTLGGTRRRWVARRGLTGLTRASVGCAALVLAAASIDRLLELAGIPLLLLALAVIAGAGAFAVWSFWELRRMPRDRQIARFIEERCPELEDRLASATEFDQEDAGPFRDLMIADAATAARSVDLDRVISQRTLRISALAAAASVLALAIAAIVATGPARRVAQTARLYLFPSAIDIEVSPGDTRVMVGDPVRVFARIRGAADAMGRVAPVVVFETGTGRRTLEMQAAGDGFEATFTSVPRSFTYHVRAANAASRDFAVTALLLPRIERIDLQYRFPGFTGLEPREERDGGDIYAPPGTRVTLEVHTNKPVSSGAMTLIDGRSIGLSSRAGTLLEGELVIDRDGSYRVALADADGLSNPGDTEYFIRTMDDRPPDVRIVRPADDRQVTPLEEVIIEARADDDYGIERLELVYAVRGGAEKVIPLARRAEGSSASGSHTLYVEDLQVSPGDFVSYYARARDVSRGKKSSEARSDIFFLEVKPFEAEFAAAQSQAMTGGGGAFEDLVGAQKELIIATWKIDRRASAGKSVQDIKALADAQLELKGRTDQAASRSGAGRNPRRMRPGQAMEDDHPLAKAAEAMGRAHVELVGSSTSSALPHEMEALNQLLKAQAEIQRRQVGRQAGGGGGSNRATRDLSALFDRELQRQQQTNYETRDSAEPRDEQNRESDALAKVRELAARQDELAKRQRELARQRAQMTQEEIRRQLERLTREQSELRREAEELSRQLARQNAQGSPQSGQQSGRQPQAGQQAGQQSGQSAQSGNRMKDISEEMQSAASDLRRADPDGASARSGRAAEKLRELERQLQGRGEGGRQRAMGDLQLEAQQLADAQRRIASETRQLEQSGTGGRDQLRRLAGEKERLAGRVEGLEDAIRSASPGANQEQRQALGQAAGELDRQQVGRRMRESAAAMRAQAGGGDQKDQSGPAGEAAKQPDRLAGREQALADSLDRVAERLGGAAGGRDAESRRLGEQLARARELRERLSDLEREIESLARSDERKKGTQADQAGQQGKQAEAKGQSDAQAGGREGSRGADQAKGADGRGGELSKLRAEYDRQLRDADDLTRQVRPQGGERGGTPEHHEYTPSAPGTEAFKQDFAKWDELRKDVNLALEKLEASLGAQLAQRDAKDRLKAGADDNLPPEYRRLVAKYYEALARKDRKP